MKKILFIFAALVAVNCFGSEKPTPEQVHKVIRLTKKQIPISRYFADDDDDSKDTSVQQPMLFRRQTAIKARTDIAPSEDDVQISDEMRVRLFLARIKALERFEQVHSSLNT